ncbi:MAG: hypothetical protein NTX45_25475 [Proteobacteria bacterium]|nr:hypothetical protein [Pseudomonadota bacterium]
MQETLVLILILLTVKQIDVQPTETTIFFTDGKIGRMSTSQKDFDYFLKLAQRSQERQHPVGVSFTNQGQITEIARADNDFPTRILEADQERMKVIFEGHDGTYYLLKNNPHFKQIRETLQQSIQEDSRIWFVAEKPRLNIMNVIKVK